MIRAEHFKSTKTVVTNVTTSRQATEILFWMNNGITQAAVAGASDHIAPYLIPRLQKIKETVVPHVTKVTKKAIEIFLDENGGGKLRAPLSANTHDVFTVLVQDALHRRDIDTPLPEPLQQTRRTHLLMAANRK